MKEITPEDLWNEERRSKIIKAINEHIELTSEYPIHGEVPALPTNVLRELWKSAKPVILKKGKKDK